MRIKEVEKRQLLDTPINLEEPEFADVDPDELFAGLDATSED